MAPSSTKLIDKIERGRRRQAHILWLIVIVSLISIISFGGFLYYVNQHQSDQRAAGIARLEAQAAQTNRYIQCLARFYGIGGRTDVLLKNLDSCSYERNGKPVPGVDLTPQVKSITTTIIQPGAKQSTNTSKNTTTTSSVSSPSSPQPAGNSPAQAAGSLQIQIDPLKLIQGTTCTPLLKICTDKPVL